MSVKHEMAALCSRARLLESIPTSSNTFTDVDITALMNQELQSTVVPTIASVREEYFVVSRDYTVDSTTSYIDIPPEAVGMRVRDVVRVLSNGQVSFLTRLNPEELAYSQSLAGYIVKNNQLIFYPVPAETQTIRVSFYKRPNDLTSTEYGVIESLDGSNTITLSNVPTEWTATTELDLIGKAQPYIGKVDAFVPVSVSTATIIVDPATYALMSVGDYVATAGMSPVPQYVPSEAIDLLVQGSALQCLKSMGDLDGYKLSAVKYDQMRQALLGLLNPRVESQSKKVLPLNTILTSMRRAGGFRGVR